MNHRTLLITIVETMEHHTLNQKKTARNLIIKAYCRQAFSSPGFYLAAIGTMMLLIFGVFTNLITAFRSKDFLEAGFHISIIKQSISSDAMIMALPILAALPFTASYIEDLQSGYIKEVLPRTGFGSYLTGHLAACGLSGGIALISGILLTTGLSALVFLPMEAAPSADAETAFWLSSLWENLVLFFCSGAFWSIFGMTMAAVTKSKYMAYASPFIFYYALIILCERYFPELYVIYPKEWIQPHNWASGTWGVVILLIEFTVLASGIFWYTASRRIKQL